MKISKKIKQLDYTVKKALGNNIYGLHKSFFLGSGIDFSEHKEYVDGESVKNIDWKASAKGEKIYSKRYNEDRDIQVLFVLDTKKSMDFGLKNTTKKQLLEEIFYSLAYSAYKNGDSYGSYFFGKSSQSIPLSKDIINLYKSIEVLDTKTKDADSKLTNALEDIVRRKIKNHLIFFLTDELLDTTAKNILKKIASTNEIVFIHIFDEFENSLTGYNGNILIGKGNSLYNLFLKKGKKRRDFQNIRNKNLEDNRNFFYKNAIRYSQLTTNEKPYVKLLQLIS